MWVPGGSRSLGPLGPFAAWPPLQVPLGVRGCAPCDSSSARSRAHLSPGSLCRDSGTATSSVDWAPWPTAPGSSTAGCGSTATQWVGVPPPSCGPFEVLLWVTPGSACFFSGGPGQSHRRCWTKRCREDGDRVDSQTPPPLRKRVLAWFPKGS